MHNSCFGFEGEGKKKITQVGRLSACKATASRKSKTRRQKRKQIKERKKCKRDNDRKRETSLLHHVEDKVDVSVVRLALQSDVRRVALVHQARAKLYSSLCIVGISDGL